MPVGARPGPINTLAVRFRVLLDRVGISTKAFVRGASGRLGGMPLAVRARPTVDADAPPNAGLLVTIAVVLLIVIIAVSASAGGRGDAGGETRGAADSSSCWQPSPVTLTDRASPAALLNPQRSETRGRP